jgi:hypothetical protein
VRDDPHAFAQLGELAGVLGMRFVPRNPDR